MLLLEKFIRGQVWDNLGEYSPLCEAVVFCFLFFLIFFFKQQPPYKKNIVTIFSVMGGGGGGGIPENC